LRRLYPSRSQIVSFSSLPYKTHLDADSRRKTQIFSCFISANQRFQRPDSKMYGRESFSSMESSICDQRQTKNKTVNKMTVLFGSITSFSSWGLISLHWVLQLSLFLQPWVSQLPPFQPLAVQPQRQQAVIPILVSCTGRAS
jgi:hypothetical protein